MPGNPNFSHDTAPPVLARQPRIRLPAAPAGKKETIPQFLNLLILATAIALAAWMLWLASHAGSAPVWIAAVVIFAMVNNTLFSILHEAVHGVFHKNQAVNDWAGRIAAAFFPSGFTFQRIAHLGHHRRNRTDAELFDYYRPGENRLLKAAQWYGILTGIYWLLPPAASLLFLVMPASLVQWAIAYSQRLTFARQTSAEGMLSGYRQAPLGRIKAEVLFTLAVQAALVWGLDLNLWGWAACYAAFGFSWSSLQYTDHAFSERDIYKGAWNLRVNPVIQTIFLNYHHHRAHHCHPTVPWIHLGRYLDESYRPTFLEIYWQMWGGPRPLP
jgi:fatty acid desaturase